MLILITVTAFLDYLELSLMGVNTKKLDEVKASYRIILNRLAAPFFSRLLYH